MRKYFIEAFFVGLWIFVFIVVLIFTSFGAHAQATPLDSIRIQLQEVYDNSTFEYLNSQEDIFYSGDCAVIDSVDATIGPVEIWVDYPLLYHKEGGFTDMFVIVQDSTVGIYKEFYVLGAERSRNYIFVEWEGYYIGAVVMYEKRLCKCCKQPGEEYVATYRQCR